MQKTVALIILLCIGIGAYFSWNPITVTKLQEESDILALYGNVEIRRANLGFRVPGRISDILFAEGDTVKKGEIIARLDREPYEDILAVAAAQVECAEANYLRLETGNRPQEIEQARATLNERMASLKVLESDVQRTERLYKSNTITLQEFETVTARRDEAEARKNLAAENLNLLCDGFRKEDIAIGKAQLSEAKANLKKAETALADTVLLCPNDGVLLTRVEEVGSVVNAGQIIATLSLKDAVWVYIYVPGPQLGKLAPGMKAEIITDTRPDAPYQGHVGYISPEAEFTPKNVETTELRTSLVYRVRIIAENPNEGLRQGMPVTVRLLLNNRQEIAPE